MILRTSRAMRIKMFQYEAIALGPYIDGDHYSIGLGHNDPTLKPEDRITVRRAFEMFRDDIRPRELQVNKFLNDDAPQNVFDAFVSMTYQSGNRYGPAMMHLWNYRKMGTEKVLEEAYPLCAYNKAGVWKNGLHLRRKDEWKVLADNDYGDLNAPIKLWHGPPEGDPEPYVLQPEDVAA